MALEGEQQLANDPTFESLRAEEARIRAAYARRKNGARYSVFQPGTLFILQQCERRMLGRLRGYGFADLQPKKILEVGCGVGYWLREFVKWGARPENITGIDLLMDSASKARQLCPPGIRIQCASAAELPFSDERFDLVFQATVFTSILDPALKGRVAAEMIRVVRREGLILWYDYHANNPSNPDVQGVRKQEIYRLFPGCRIDLERITLAPPVARWIAPRSWLLASVLERIPLLRTHYLGSIRKPKSEHN